MSFPKAMTLTQLPTLLTLVLLRRLDHHVLLRRLDHHVLLDPTPGRPGPHAARCAWCVWREGEALANLGEVCFLRHDPVRAIAFWGEARAIFEACGDVERVELLDWKVEGEG